MSHVAVADVRSVDRRVRVIIHILIDLGRVDFLVTALSQVV